MGVLSTYRLGLERKRRLIQALRKSRELQRVAFRAEKIRKDDILLLCTLRNERPRLTFFLEYYRNLGVDHFLIVDNGSDDGSREFLADQPDVSLWGTDADYGKARFGIDWLNAILYRYGHNHWTLVVDVDEFFVYPFCDSRPLKALTDWLDASAIRSFGAMMLDVYPKEPVAEATCLDGQNPLEVAEYFDPGNYMISHNAKYGNLWIQGGPRARLFFANEPFKAPALNKIPLVKWNRSNVFVSSTHMLLPRGLNLVYETDGGEKASGCLLHTKFLNTFIDKTAEEMHRSQHYGDGEEYRAYANGLEEGGSLWCKWSEKYINWRQLEILGLMSKGNWV